MTNSTDTNKEVSGYKSKGIASILAFCFLGLGIYNFYLGYLKKAFIQILLCGAGILFIVLGVIYATIALRYHNSPALPTTGFYLGIAMLTATVVWSITEGILLLMGRIKTDGKKRTFYVDTNRTHKKKAITALMFGILCMAFIAATSFISVIALSGRGTDGALTFLIGTTVANALAPIGLALSIYCMVKGASKRICIAGIVFNAVVVFFLLLGYIWCLSG